MFSRLVRRMVIYGSLVIGHTTRRMATIGYPAYGWPHLTQVFYGRPVIGVLKVGPTDFTTVTGAPA